MTLWVQPTVTFATGDHVNVLHDYKKKGPILSKSHISNSFKMAERSIPVNVYQFLHKLLSTRLVVKKIAKNPSAY